MVRRDKPLDAGGGTTSTNMFFYFSSYLAVDSIVCGARSYRWSFLPAKVDSLLRVPGSQLLRVVYSACVFTVEGRSPWITCWLKVSINSTNSSRKSIQIHSTQVYFSLHFRTLAVCVVKHQSIEMCCFFNHVTQLAASVIGGGSSPTVLTPSRSFQSLRGFLPVTGQPQLQQVCDNSGSNSPGSRSSGCSPPILRHCRVVSQILSRLRHVYCKFIFTYFASL